MATPEQQLLIDRIHELGDQGITVPKIAKIVEMSPTTIYDWMKKGFLDTGRIKQPGSGNYEQVKDNREKNQARTNKTQRLLDEGRSVREVASIIGVSRASIYNWKKDGLISIDSTARRQAKVDRIHELGDQGHPPKSIAKIVGITPQMVYYWKKKGVIDASRIPAGVYGYSRFTDKERQAMLDTIHRLADEGHSIQDAANYVKVAVMTIYRWCDLGLLDKDRFKRKGIRERDDKIEKAHQLAMDGHSIPQISKILGLGHSTIYNWKSEGLLDPGIVVKDRDYWNEKQKQAKIDKVNRLTSEGRSVKEIASIVDMKPATIYNWRYKGLVNKG